MWLLRKGALLLAWYGYRNVLVEDGLSFGFMVSFSWLNDCWAGIEDWVYTHAVGLWAITLNEVPREIVWLAAKNGYFPP
jgi:hypothetical protein